MTVVKLRFDRPVPAALVKPTMSQRSTVAGPSGPPSPPPVAGLAGVDAEGVADVIGVTEQFRSHLKRQHMSGVTWASWEAHPVKTRKDGFELRKQLRDRYAEGNVATRTRANTSGREVWLTDSTFDVGHDLREDRS